MNEPRGMRFNTSAASVGGAFSGVLFAVGVPWVLLVHGAVLGEVLQRVLVIGAICLGGLIALAAAVLGVVMPNEIPMEPSHRGRARAQSPSEPA